MQEEIPAWVGSSYACPYCKAPTLTPGACSVCEREQVVEHEKSYKPKLKFHKPFGYAILVGTTIALIIYFIHAINPITILGFISGVSCFALCEILIEKGPWWSSETVKVSRDKQQPQINIQEKVAAQTSEAKASLGDTQ